MKVYLKKYIHLLAAMLSWLPHAGFASPDCLQFGELHVKNSQNKISIPEGKSVELTIKLPDEVYGFAAEVTRIQLGDYSVYFARDKNGRVHFFDDAFLDGQRIFYPAKGPGQAPKESLSFLDNKKFKKAYCAERARFSENFPSLEAMTGQFLRTEIKENIILKNFMGCLGFYVADFAALTFGWSITANMRKDEEWKHDYLLNHASNFYMSFLIAATAHRCAALVSRRWGLPAAMVVSSGANLGNELWFEDYHKDIDWEDVAAGELGAGAYVALGAFFDRQNRNKLTEDICR